jgi:hypothetical protein
MPESENKLAKTEETSEKKELSEIIKKFDVIGVGELIAFLKSPVKLFFLNLLAGVARGLGFAIGFTILAALMLLILRRAVSVPVIGAYIAKILEVIELQRKIY